MSHLKQFRFAGFAKVVAQAAFGAALGWNPIAATAASRPDVPRLAAGAASVQDDVDLERLFWLCDHAAATRMIDANERLACDAVTAQLKAEKFGGDFDQLLNWWRTNKVVQHRKLDEDDDSGTAK